MGWVDAARAVREVGRLAKALSRRRKPPVDVEPEASPISMGQSWQALVDREVQNRTRQMMDYRSAIAELAERDPARGTEAAYRAAAEAYGNGDMPWSEFESYRKAFKRRRPE